MPLHHVHPNHLPTVWPIALPLLKKAMDLEPGSHNEQFIEYSIRTGKTHLMVWEEPGEGITGACTIEFIDYPMERIAHVNLMGGKGIVRDYVFDEAKELVYNYLVDFYSKHYKVTHLGQNYYKVEKG